MKVRIEEDEGVPIKAYASKQYTEKYVRKVLQDKLKSQYGYRGGWNLYASNRYGDRKDEKEYEFEINNIFRGF